MGRYIGDESGGGFAHLPASGPCDHRGHSAWSLATRDQTPEQPRACSATAGSPQYRSRGLWRTDRRRLAHHITGPGDVRLQVYPGASSPTKRLSATSAGGAPPALAYRLQSAPTAHRPEVLPSGCLDLSSS